MKRQRTLSLFTGLGLVSLSASLLATPGCSSSSTTVTTVDSGHPSQDAGKTDTGSSKSDAAKDAGNTTITPGTPPQPSGSATTSTTKHNLALRYLYFGDTDPTSQFTADANAWKSFGYNLDGLDSTAASTDVCTPAATATGKQDVDGTGGIDNAFGNTIITALSTFGISSTEISTDLAEGHFTLEIDTVGLTTTAGQTNTGLSGSFYAGATYAGTPPVTGTSFSISDNWPINGSFLVDPTSVASGSTLTFPNAYVTDGVWVSGTPSGAIPLNLILAGHTLTVNIHAGIVTMPITTDSSGQMHVKKGVIAGVVDTSEILAELPPLLAGTGFCSAVSFAANLMTGAQDIILNSDGTVSNKAGTPCNAISVGLAFDADEIAQPSTIATPVDAGAPATCSDAGSSSSSSSSTASSSSSSSGSGSSSTSSTTGSSSSTSSTAD